MRIVLVNTLECDMHTNIVRMELAEKYHAINERQTPAGAHTD